MSVNPSAEAGFGAGAERYQRTGPSYPIPAVQPLCQEPHIGPGRIVLDVAAGPGKLTRLLRDAEGTIIAVEPSLAMPTQFAAVPRSIVIREGTAEAIPLADLVPTRSYIAAMPPDDRNEVLDRLGGYVRRFLSR
jgi:hypothetical protein